MKPKSLFIVFTLLALVVTACAPAPTPTPATPIPIPTQAAQDDSWTKVQQAGVLRVGTSGDYPPFEYFNDKYQLDGFDIALINEIGRKLGVTVELNPFGFDGLPTTVAIGQVDVAIAALSVTPERQSIAEFSNVYYASTDAVLSRPEANPQNMQNPASLAVARLGVQTNSIYATYAQQQLLDTGLMPKQNLYVYADISQAVNDLKVQRLDAVWMDLEPAQAYVDTGGVKILAQGLNQQLYAIGMMKGAVTLRDKINEALTQLQNEGTLARLQQQYLGVSSEDYVPPQPLPTPMPAQPTPVPAGCSDGAEYVKDLSYDDNDMKEPPTMKPGQAFTKGWRMRNVGSCTWKSGYSLTFSYGNVPAAQMGGQPVPVTKEVKPNETYDFYVNLVAPIVAGTYQGFWNMRNPKNQQFGRTIWVGIRVVDSATPTPHPTDDPSPGISFKADPTKVKVGESVLFKWKVDKASAVYFYHDGQNWQDHAVGLSSQASDYPPYTMNYYLRVVQSNGSVDKKTIGITVTPADEGVPVITHLGASPPQITVGECVVVDWTTTGKITQVTLVIDDVPTWENAPLNGNYPDCPISAGTRVYKLEVAGPGGNAAQQVTVNAQDVPQKPTPTPTQSVPVPQPPAIQNFTVAPTSIEQNQCVTASWSTGGGTTKVQLLRDGAVILDNAPLNNSVPDCPPNAAPATIKYTLIAVNNAGEQISRDTSVQVAEAPPQNTLANTNWVLKKMQGEEVSVEVTAFFGADGSLTGNSGCNSYGTSYIASGQAITIQAPGSTGAACGDPMDSVEQAYLALLPQAANFQIDGTKLIILGNSGQEILRFTVIQ